MNQNLRVEIADSMNFERWTAYMWSILLSLGLQKTHYITRDSDKKSWVKKKQHGTSMH